MAQTIWSVIAVIGALALIVLLLWSLATGRDDRDKEEEARNYFDEHGHWPDESPN
jgi:type II secretory pathway pseudopilin PulG